MNGFNESWFCKWFYKVVIMFLENWQKKQVIMVFRKKCYLGSWYFNQRFGFYKMASMRGLELLDGVINLQIQHLVVMRLGRILRGEEETSEIVEEGYSWGNCDVFIDLINGLKIHQVSPSTFKSTDLFSYIPSNMPIKGKQIVEYSDSDSNQEYSSINIIPISEIENLSASFKRKVNLPIKTVPFVKTPFMEQIEEEKNKFSIVFRCIDVILATSTVRNQIRKMWPDFYFKDPFPLSNEVFQVNLTKVEDFRRAIMEQPWILHNHVIQVVPWKVYQGDEVFKNFYVWFQIPAMPEIYVEEKAIEDILRNSELFLPNQILKCEIVNEEDEEEKYARIKVILDVSEPLPPGIRVPLNGAKVTVPFVYEFLHMLCYRCGRIGHHQHNCDIPENAAGNVFSPRNRTFSSSPPSKKLDSSIRLRIGNVRGEMGQIKQSLRSDMELIHSMKDNRDAGFLPKNAQLVEVKIEEFKGTKASPSTFNPFSLGKIDAAFKRKDMRMGGNVSSQVVIPGLGMQSKNPAENQFGIGTSSNKEWGGKIPEDTDYNRGNWASNFRFQAKENYDSDPEYKPKQTWIPKRNGQTIGERVSSRIWRDRSCTKQKKRQAEICGIPGAQGASKKICMIDIMEGVSSTNVEQAEQEEKVTGNPSNILVSSALDLLQQCYNDPLIREVVEAEAKRTGRTQSPPHS